MMKPCSPGWSAKNGDKAGCEHEITLDGDLCEGKIRQDVFHFGCSIVEFFLYKVSTIR